MSRSTNRPPAKKPSQKKAESGKSTIAIIISIVTFFFTVFNFVWVEVKTNKDNQEWLSIIVKPSFSHYPIKIQNFAEDQILLRIKYKCTVSNNSKRALSLVDYKIDSELEDREGSSIIYCDLDKGLFSGNCILDFPINLQPAESKSFDVYLGIIIKGDTYNVITQEYDLNESVDFMELVGCLAEHQIDLYGDSIYPIMNQNKLMSYTVYKYNDADHKYFITFYSSKKGVFRSQFENSPYSVFFANMD